MNCPSAEYNYTQWHTAPLRPWLGNIINQPRGNRHTMWIANLPWCSTLNYQTWCEYIRTCVEHLLGISNEHITWWVNLMIGEYIIQYYKLSHRCHKPSLQSTHLNSVIEFVSYIDFVVRYHGSTSEIIKLSSSTTRTKWFDILTHSTLRALANQLLSTLGSNSGVWQYTSSLYSLCHHRRW